MSGKITAEMVKTLRERTGGVSFMECKNALEAAEGDMEAAVLLIRKRGQAKAEKRADKAATEGQIIGAASDNQKTALIAEINCETDFVARDSHFQLFAKMVAERALAGKMTDVSQVLTSTVNESSNETIEHARQALVAKVGENIQVRRITLLTSPGIVGTYTHGHRIGVIVAIDKVDPELARDLAMHIAAIHPQAIDSTGVPKDLIEREREIFVAQAQESGKPADIVEKMIMGRINKFLQEICLMSQPFVKDPKQTVAELLSARQAHVLSFTRYELGEEFKN